MEEFVNKTDVSFSQLFKKDGWFARLIFIQLIVSPIHALIARSLRLFKSPSDFVYFFILAIAGHLAIGFLLWKKRTRFTITVSIVLLWILFLLQRVFSLLIAIGQLAVALHREEVSNKIINYRISVLVYAVVLVVIALVLNVIWTRNLKRLKRFCP